MQRQSPTSALLAIALAVGLGPALIAQAAVTTADIQRLQDAIFEASREVGQLRNRDVALASELETQLDEARDEAIYLRVKLRKNEPIVRSEYSQLRDRIAAIRSRARGETAPTQAKPAASGAKPAAERTARASETRPDVPVGTELDVRLGRSLSSKTAEVEDRFEATTVIDLREGDRVVVPAGSALRGIISSVDRAGRIDRRGSLTVAFDQITVRGQSYPIRATVTQALESEGVRGETARIGAGAGIGAIIGGILGGVRGALAGILIGAGGTIAATEGQDVELPAGTLLRVRMDAPLDLPD